MHRGGEMRLRGTPGKNDLLVGCTTLELGNAAQMDLENVHLGSMKKGSGNRGEANVKETARLTGRNVSIDTVTFHTEDEGTIELSGIQRRGKVIVRAEGGPVVLDASAGSEAD